MKASFFSPTMPCKHRDLSLVVQSLLTLRVDEGLFRSLKKSKMAARVRVGIGVVTEVGVVDGV